MILSQRCQVNKFRPLMSSKFPWQSVESQVSSASKARWGGPLKVHILFWKEQQQQLALQEHRAEGKKWIRKFHWHSIFYHHRAMRWKNEKIWTKDRNAGFQSCVLVFFKQIAWMICMTTVSASLQCAAWIDCAPCWNLNRMRIFWSKVHFLGNFLE